MALIAVATAGKIEVVESIIQSTHPAAETIVAGAPVRFDTSAGTFANANATDASEARAYGIALRSVIAGQALTAMHLGVLDGFTLAGNYGTDVYLADTDARLADAAGTVNVKVGIVLPGTSTTLGVAYDKILFVDFSKVSDQVDTDAERVVITTDLMAASVDKWVFVADRAYQVMGFGEIHSVVGGSGALVRPRKVTAAGTAAPGDAAGATVKELTAADIDLTSGAPVNVAQAPALTATAADALLAAGDKIGLNFSGTLTGLVGHLTISLKPV